MEIKRLIQILIQCTCRNFSILYWRVFISLKRFFISPTQLLLLEMSNSRVSVRKMCAILPNSFRTINHLDKSNREITLVEKLLLVVVMKRGFYLNMSWFRIIVSFCCSLNKYDYFTILDTSTEGNLNQHSKRFSDLLSTSTVEQFAMTTQQLPSAHDHFLVKQKKTNTFVFKHAEWISM